MKKKEYKKPMIRMEAYTLAQSIARNCGYSSSNPTEFGVPTYQDIGSCGWQEAADYGDSDIYWLEGTICTVEVDEDYDLEGICYENPSGGVVIFGSA